MSTLLVETSSGPILPKDMPTLDVESQASQNLRMGLTMGILAVVSVMFLMALNRKDYTKFYNVDFDESNISQSYLDRESGKNMKQFIFGKTIQIYTPEDDVEIQYILPRYSSQEKAKGDKSANDGYFGAIGDSMNKIEPILQINQEQGKGSMFHINLGDEQPISEIAIMGSSVKSNYKKLSTAKVMIRDDEGKKVWQSCNYLLPQQFQVINVDAA
jgi:hypothetical protein